MRLIRDIGKGFIGVPIFGNLFINTVENEIITEWGFVILVDN